MNEYNQKDTITAIASPPGKGAISIIRLSGNKTFPIINKIFRPLRIKKQKYYKPGSYLGEIVADKKSIDQVVLHIQKRPHSYTGEDLAEINCHGNLLITNTILNLLIQKGARLAQAGEFTYRAFLNNKIDLIQAEAVNELINAKTYNAVEMALKHLAGDLSGELQKTAGQIKKILMDLEVRIDHPDEEMEMLENTDILKDIRKVKQKISQLIETYEAGKLINKGITVTIVGKANAGKSSLFNILIKRDKSIISPVPGTTRDIVEEYIEIDHFPVKLIDTAGIKKAGNAIEEQALKRTYHAVSEADILLIIMDRSRACSRDDEILLQYLEKLNSHKIFIFNKTELPDRFAKEKLKPYIQGSKILSVSVSRETNIDQIESGIKSCLDRFHLKEGNIISNLRQKEILKKTKDALEKAVNSIENGLFYDIIAVDIRAAVQELSCLTGQYTYSDMLNDIFSRFCLGK